MDSPTIALVGAGQMGRALLRGWLAAIQRGGGLTLSVLEPNFEPALAVELEAAGAVLNPSAALTADAVVLAIKPQAFRQAAPQIRALVGPDTLVVSVMAGVTIEAIRQGLGAQRIVRAMPNTPGQIGHGVTGVVSFGCDDRHADLAAQLLDPLGSVEVIADEAMMDAVTAVSGSGPAYVFLLAEAMTEAGVALGLDHGVAGRLAARTIAGAGALMLQSGQPPEDLRRQVTSPGGTTQAALDVLLQKNIFSETVGLAIAAAARRSRELGAPAVGTELAKDT